MDGVDASVERWAFIGEPELQLVRARVGESWLSVRGRTLSQSELMRLVGMLRRLQLESPLFDELRLGLDRG